MVVYSLYLCVLPEVETFEILGIEISLQEFKWTWARDIDDFTNALKVKWFRNICTDFGVYSILFILAIMTTKDFLILKNWTLFCH